MNPTALNLESDSSFFLRFRFMTPGLIGIRFMTRMSVKIHDSRRRFTPRPPCFWPPFYTPFYTNFSTVYPFFVHKCNYCPPIPSHKRQPAPPHRLSSHTHSLTPQAPRTVHTHHRIPIWTAPVEPRAEPYQSDGLQQVPCPPPYFFARAMASIWEMTAASPRHVPVLSLG